MRLVTPLLACALLTAGCGNGDGQPAGAPTASSSSSRSTEPPDVEPEDPLSPKPALESPAPLGRPACRAADLSVADGDLLTSSTSLEEVFVLRTSGPACELRGWPTVRLLDGVGADLHFDTRRVGTARAVTLSRGTSLTFALTTPRSSSCQDAATIVVRLPGTDQDLRAATSMQVCDRSLAAGPVERRQEEEGSEH